MALILFSLPRAVYCNTRQRFNLSQRHELGFHFPSRKGSKSFSLPGIGKLNVCLVAGRGSKSFRFP
jgi:hypothetical protein